MANFSTQNFSSNTQHLITPEILREYDVRGTWRKNLSVSDAYAVGLRFGSDLKATGGNTVVLGFDGRLSTPTLVDVLQNGLTDAGINIINVGLGPTPMIYFALQTLDVDASIMVTGSHNPKDDNGFKMALKARPFYGDDIRNLNVLTPNLAKTKGTIAHHDISEAYLDRLLKDYAPTSKKLKIAFDPGNGAAAALLTKLTHRLQCETVLINNTVDGTFPAHHPDPTVPENLKQLIEAVQSEECDFGIAFDGDADRIGVVDAKGNIFFGDHLMMIYARDVLQRNPGATIIADVKASQTLFDTITACGGIPLMWRTGHSLIKAKMKETGAKLAGEMSGHIFIADGYYGYDDALYAAMRLIDILSNSEQSLSEIYEAFPKLHTTPELRIPVAETEKFSIVEKIITRLKAENATFSDVDGARVNRENGWWLVRASNTQAILVARAESTTHDGMLELTNELHAYLNCYITH